MPGVMSWEPYAAKRLGSLSESETAVFSDIIQAIEQDAKLTARVGMQARRECQSSDMS
jgi:hypothetical protein